MPTIPQDPDAPAAAAVGILKALHHGEPREVASRLLARRRELDAIARFLVDERLGVWAFAATDARGLSALWPASALACLRDQWTAQQDRTARLLGALASIDEAFRRDGIEYLVLKGLPMAERFHGGADHRFTWDLDLLVREADVARARRALDTLGVHGPALTAGLNRIAMRVAHALECRREDGLSVDLHWAFRRLPGLRFPADEVFRRGVVCELDGRCYPAPADEHLLLQVLLGIAADVDRGLCRLRALWDASLLLREVPAAAWEDFLARRSAEGCRRLTLNAAALAVHGTFAEDELATFLDSAPHDGRMPDPIGAERARSILARAPHSVRNHLEFASWQDPPAWRYWSWWGATLPARAFFARRF